MRMKVDTDELETMIIPIYIEHFTREETECVLDTGRRRAGA